MSTIRAVKFEPWHSQAIKLREEDRLCVDELGHNADHCATVPAFTIIAEEIVACAGYTQRMGVADIWMLTSPLVDKYRFWFYRNMDLINREVVMKEDIHRMQAIVRASNEQGHRWMRHFKFEKEGVLRKLAPNSDYVLYARLI